MLDPVGRRLAHARAAVAGHVAKVADLGGARLAVVRRAHRQRRAPAHVVGIELARGRAAVRVGRAQLADRTACAEQDAPLRGAGAAAATAHRAARLSGRMARWGRRRAHSAHAAAPAAVGRHAARRPGDGALGPGDALERAVRAGDPARQRTARPSVGTSLADRQAQARRTARVGEGRDRLVGETRVVVRRRRFEDIEGLCRASHGNRRAEDPGRREAPCSRYLRRRKRLTAAGGFARTPDLRGCSQSDLSLRSSLRTREPHPGRVRPPRRSRTQRSRPARRPGPGPAERAARGRRRGRA